MSTRFVNTKAGKPIPRDVDEHVRETHEQAAGRSRGPRAAANTFTGRESKAMRHTRKK